MMKTNIIGIKQLHTQLKQITQAVAEGEFFIVVKNSQPVFRIEPLEPTVTKKYSLHDFKKLQVKGKDKNLSAKIDEVVYGV